MPEWKHEIRGRIEALGLDPTREADIVEELSQHLDDLYDEALARGASSHEARTEALAALADGGALARELRGVERRGVAPVPLGGIGRRSLLGDFVQDARYCVRVLRKHPAYALMAVLTLALGIGANAVIFSVVHGVLLRPLPYRDADRLVVVAEKNPKGIRAGVAYLNYLDWRERARAFDETALYWNQNFNLTGGETPVRVSGRFVTWTYFDVLGAPLRVGRGFAEEDERPGAPPVTLISERLWNSRFGGNPSVIGQTLRANGDPYTIVGVLGPGSDFGRSDDVFFPLTPAITPKSGMLDRGNHFSMYAIAHLAPGFTVEQASAEMASIAEQLAAEHPDSNSGQSANAQLVNEAIVEDVRPALLVLLGAVGFVLLIACVNVANLTLVRAAERHREIALRLALGAARGRIVRQLLSESLVVSVLGGIAGFALGAWTLRGLVALAPASVPRLDEVRVDPAVIAFTAALTLATGVLFGLLPALHASRADLQATLKEGGRTFAGSARERMRKVLLVAEVALALVLLAGAGLMLRTVSELAHVDPGFDPNNLLTARLTLPENMYPVERRRPFFDACLERVRAVPGVRAAAFTMSLPIDGSNWNSVFVVADKPVPERSGIPNSAFIPVSDGYFDTMGMRLLRGRNFGSSDTETSPKIAIVNEAFARRMWPGEDPIGKRLKQGWPESETPWREVVGVVADMKLEGVDADTPMQAYLPLTHEPTRYLGLVVRTAGDPDEVGPALERAVRDVDPELPLYSVRSMDSVLGNAIAQQRLTSALLAGFALLALLLAAIGIYGVMSYAVTQRTHEIGVRLALGARPNDVLRMVVGHGLALALAGVGIGLAAALALTRVMTAMLFGVSATDPTTYVAISLLLAGVAALACYVPARRATRVDPLVALRYE